MNIQARALLLHLLIPSSFEPRLSLTPGSLAAFVPLLAQPQGLREGEDGRMKTDEQYELARAACTPTRGSVSLVFIARSPKERELPPVLHSTLTPSSWSVH